MENYKITKKQIAILSNTSHEAFTYLNEEFPEAFKTELTIGKWYKYKLALFYVTNKASNHTNYYNVFGFDVDGNWMTDNAKTWFDENYIEATPEEVKVALNAEAKKRGYKKGEWCKFGNSGMIRKLDSDCITWVEDWGGIGIGGLSIGGNIIFSDGEWVEILPQGKTVVPMAKALKIIAKKMKVSPENIEIQS